MKVNLGKLFDNRRLMILLAVVLAILAWLAVVYSIDPNTKKTVRDVPVDVSKAAEEILGPLNLQIVDGASSTVDVTITGARNVVGGITPADIDIAADLSGITEPGTFDVPLYGRKTGDRNEGDKYGKNFQLSEANAINPSTVRIRVDRLKKKTFTITTDIEGLQIPERYIGSETILNPKEVTITGPEADINRIDRVVVFAEFNEPLTSTRTVKSEILLYDVEGGEISKEFLTLDSETADITIPVLKRKELPIKFEYLNVPSGFPIHLLDYTLSRGYINVAGPESVVDTYEDLNIGFVNVDEITKEKVFIFDVDLPTGFRNLDDVSKIELQFDTEDMLEANFTIPGSNIVAINVPVNYTVTISTPSISGVHVLGDAETMRTLSGQDLVATIDLSSREITPGPYDLPVQISIPGKGLVWATGEYTAVVDIKEKTNQ